MELSKVEQAKLDKAKETFNTETLTEEQAQLILGRELNDKVWRAYMAAESRKITRQKATKYTQLKVYLENLNTSRQNHNFYIRRYCETCCQESPEARFAQKRH